MKKPFFVYISSLILLHALASPSPSRFLASLGYDFSQNHTEKTFFLPNSFDLVYNNYNGIQKEAGFDLLPYRGKRCIMYTYEIYNHPFGKCRANIIVCQSQIIGGDISSVSLDGFMTGLVPKNSGG